MKTVMQDMLGWVRATLPMDLDTPRIIENKIEALLIKEKEQMLNFGLYVKKNGWVGCKIEDLYEDYNNQNK